MERTARSRYGGQDRTGPRGYVAHIFIKVLATEPPSLNASNVIRLRAFAFANRISRRVRASPMTRLFVRRIIVYRECPTAMHICIRDRCIVPYIFIGLIQGVPEIYCQI